MVARGREGHGGGLTRLGVLLSLVFWSSWGGFGGRRTTVVEERRY